MKEELENSRDVDTPMSKIADQLVWVNVNDFEEAF